MPTFAQVGDYLKHKYENAVQVGMVLLFMSLSALDLYLFIFFFSPFLLDETDQIRQNGESL